MTSPELLVQATSIFENKPWILSFKNMKNFNLHMSCTRTPVGLTLLIYLLFIVSPALGCGIMPPGQARRITFNVTGFNLPVNMVWTTPTEAVKVSGILGSAIEVQSFVQRVTMQAVIDVLEEQGRRAGLFPAVISAILDQLRVETNYNPLKCEEVHVNPGQQTMGKNGACYIVGNTVSSICRMTPGECMYMNFMGVVPVPETHRTISGTVSTTNMIMANWSTQMWQSVMNRVARSLSAQPLGSNFNGAYITVGS
ncbi:hypothetical protein KIN20_013568 [Parelaphostrongylus tenuis]|uniref:Uncharacterized protein n=1 Tax=Parelaphostrongylus tenuis TaxID=148309 RepID=A0AAD5MCA8_PARTN|nr:hypothetical protein KIN20_013568 [Parelaphostrongylus tenuis]